jgi:hypothetical protein
VAVSRNRKARIERAKRFEADILLHQHRLPWGNPDLSVP